MAWIALMYTHMHTHDINVFIWQPSPNPDRKAGDSDSTCSPICLRPLVRALYRAYIVAMSHELYTAPTARHALAYPRWIPDRARVACAMLAPCATPVCPWGLTNLTGCESQKTLPGDRPVGKALPLNKPFREKVGFPAATPIYSPRKQPHAMYRGAALDGLRRR